MTCSTVSPIRDESGKLKLSNRYFNADGSKAPQIRLNKKVDGDTVYVSECVPDSKNKRIYITSAYKKSNTNQLLNIDLKESPQPTPEATFDNSVTNDSIAPLPKNVKYSLSAEQEKYFENSLDDTIENVEKILYDSDNPLAVVNRAKTKNNSSIKWVYKSEIFSVTENKLFHEKISEINQGSQAFEKNPRGEYMLPIENKIIFTNGDYDYPYIREIIEVLTEHQTEFEEIRRRIFNVEKGKSTKQDALRTITQVFGDGNIISYRSGNNGVYDWQNGQRKGKTRRTVVRNYLNKQYRTGNDKQIQKTKVDLNESTFLMAKTINTL